MYPTPNHVNIHTFASWLMTPLQRPITTGEIVECEVVVTLDAITADLYGKRPDGAEFDTRMVIDHTSFESWVDSKGYLRIECGEHVIVDGAYEDRTYTMTISYAEYLQDYLRKSDIQEYLAIKGFVTCPWAQGAVA